MRDGKCDAVGRRRHQNADAAELGGISPLPDGQVVFLASLRAVIGELVQVDVAKIALEEVHRAQRRQSCPQILRAYAGGDLPVAVAQHVEGRLHVLRPYQYVDVVRHPATLCRGIQRNAAGALDQHHLASGIRHRLGQTEIDDLHFQFSRSRVTRLKHNVARLEVAMDQTLSRGSDQRLRHLSRNFYNQLWIQRTVSSHTSL